ncbi:MAG: NYN domain-containing protein [Candidatus Peregrinibacteria bacterium]
MRVALFIDEANLYFSQRTLKWEIDFERLYKYFDERFAMYNSFFYAPEPPDEEEEKKKSYQQLSLLGYTLRLKKLKEIRGKSGEVVAKKANLDIEMAIDMFATKDHYDIAIMFTGDSDFVRAVELLRMHGKQIFVFSTKGHSSLEIINAADKFIDYKDLRHEFEKKKPEKVLEEKPEKVSGELASKPARRRGNRGPKPSGNTSPEAQ